MPRKGWSALDSERLVPGDPRSQATFCSLAQVQSRWCLRRSRSPFHHGAGGVKSDQGVTPQGGVGKCQEACVRIGGCYLCHDCQRLRRDVFRGDFAEGFSGKGEAKCSRAQFVAPVEGAMEFVERARKRLASHDAQRAVLEKELVDGETRVQRLEAEVSRGASPNSCRVGCRGFSVDGETCNDGAEQDRLREGAVRAPNSERMSDAPSIAGIPPMPHHAEEVEQWLIDRNCELRSALHCQDTHMIAHIGALIAKGASKLSLSNQQDSRGRLSWTPSLQRPTQRGGASKPVRTLSWWETMCREKFKIWTSRSANRGGFAPRTEVASQMSRIKGRCCCLFG